MAVEELVAYAHHADALAGIAEGLRAADEQHVVVGIATHRRLVGRLEGHAEVLAEVHGEVCQVLHDDGVVLCCQLADGLQFLLVQTDPCGVVGVAIDDGADVALPEVALHLGTELVATEVIDVEGLVLHAHDLQLHLLHGESGVDEEHRVAALVGLRAGEERGEGALHGARHGHAALGSDVQSDEGLDEARRLLLQHGSTLNVGVRMGDAALEGFHLCIDTHLCGGQSGDAHLHLDELYPTLLLGLGSHLLHLANGRLGEVVDTQLGYELVNDFSFYRCFFHNFGFLRLQR